MGLGRSLYFSGLASALKFLLQIGLSVFVARMLTPEEIGSFGVALAAAAFARAFESAGINNFVASYKALDTAVMRSVFTVNGLLNLSIGVVLWLLATPLGHFFNSDDVARILEITAVATALNTHIPIISGLLRRQMRFRALMAFDLTLAFAGGAVTVIAVVEGMGPLALALALVAEKVGAILIGLVAFRRDIPVWPQLRHARTILDYGLTLSAATVIGMVGAHSSNFILGKILGLAPSAQFDRALTLPRLIWGIVLPSFHNVLVPGVAREGDNAEARRLTTENTLLLFTLILWPAAIVLALVSPDVVVTLFGDQWWEAAHLAPYFVIYSTVVSPATLACSGLVAMGKGRAMIKIQVTEQGTKIAVLLTVFFVDLSMLAKLMSIAYAAYMVTTLYFLRKYELLDLKRTAMQMMRPMRLSLLCVIPVAAGRIWIGPGAYFTLEQLVGLAIACAVIFLLGLRLIEPGIFERGLEVIGLRKETDTPRSDRL